MKNFKSLTAIGVGLMLSLPTAGIKVHTIGDSTMANYEENRVTRGWAQYLQLFLEGVTVNNRAKGGASSKSFYREAAYWQSVKRQMEAGDYVLIQFAHNDEKTGGTDGDSLIAYYRYMGNDSAARAVDYRGTTPFDTYKQYLRRYVNETRQAGCTPVFVSPICRMYFDAHDIRRNGRHDLGEKFNYIDSNGLKTAQKRPADDHTMDYVWQMRQVAEEMNVPFLDLTEATRHLFLSYGDTQCHTLLSDGNGSTHLNATGATLIARLAAQLMKDNGILASHVRLTSELNVYPQTADLGNAYQGQTLVKEFSLNGFELVPASGTITITASEGIKVSSDKTDWASTVTQNYTNASLVTNFYARIKLTHSGLTKGFVIVKAHNKEVRIPLSATAINLAEGREVTVTWPLDGDDSYTLDGAATILAENWSQMKVQKYAEPKSGATVWPKDVTENTRKTQRNLIESGTWPEGEIDEVSTRYIEFGIAPAKNTTLRVDSIGLYVGGAGGNGMRCHINYFTHTTPNEQTNIFAPEKMSANTMYEVSYKPVLSLDEGDTLRLRIYPWYNGKSIGKTLCLSHVTIHGKATDATASGIISRSTKPTKPENNIWYDLQGRRLGTLRKGICISQGKKYMFK